MSQPKLPQKSKVSRLIGRAALLAVAVLTLALAWPDQPPTKSHRQTKHLRPPPPLPPLHPLISPAPPFDPDAALCAETQSLWNGRPVILVGGGKRLLLCIPRDDFSETEQTPESLYLAYLNPARIKGLTIMADINSFLISALPYDQMRANVLRGATCADELMIGPLRYRHCKHLGEDYLEWLPDSASPSAVTLAPPHIISCMMDEGQSIATGRYGHCSLNLDTGAGYVSVDMIGHDTAFSWPIPRDDIPRIVENWGLILREMDITTRPEAAIGIPTRPFSETPKR